MKIAVSGGGTGGHTLPVLAVVSSLQRLGSHDIVFIGSRFGMESRIIPKIGIKYYGVSTGKFRRYHKSKILNIIDPTTFFKNSIDLFRFVRGIFEARKVLLHEDPDVLFAKGGYVSLPVGLAAKTLGIPIVIHESDLVMGLANRKLSGLAKKVCLSFPLNNFPDISENKAVYTGNPIREDILAGDRGKYLRSIGFSVDRKTILVMGGSQGSKFINDVFFDALRDVLMEHQVVWVVGERDFGLVEYRITEIDKELLKSLKIYGFVNSEIADIYAAADLFIGRSGSNVIFELAAHGVPALFIPLESSAGGHQFENARLLSRSGAAYVMSESTLTPKKLYNQINNVLSSTEDLKNMAEKMKSWSNIQAASEVAKVIVEIGEESVEQSRANKK